MVFATHVCVCRMKCRLHLLMKCRLHLFALLRTKVMVIARHPSLSLHPAIRAYLTTNAVLVQPNATDSHQTYRIVTICCAAKGIFLQKRRGHIVQLKMLITTETRLQAVHTADSSASYKKSRARDAGDRQKLPTCCLTHEESVHLATLHNHTMQHHTPPSPTATLHVKKTAVLLFLLQRKKRDL